MASDLMRFPKVLEKLPGVLAPSMYHNTVAELHHLYDARDTIGFVLVNPDGLKRLIAARPNHEPVQTAYIPPRIWSYQVGRLRACLDDFLAHREQVESCYGYCLDAYCNNFGSLKEALRESRDRDRGPFNSNAQGRTGCTYVGPFAGTATQFGIRDLLERWLDTDSRKLGIKSLYLYLSLVSFAGLTYIANFTLQRKEEAALLRADSLMWENDERLGRVPIICGETTKTDPDSDARWVTSPSVAVAVEAMTLIARLRMRCAQANPAVAPTSSDIANPYLFSSPDEPWSAGTTRPYSLRSKVGGFREYLKKFPKLLDPEQLRIREDDLRIARQLTPNLPGDEFAVGLVWPLAWHQYRRTSAVNMFSSGYISDSTMQHQLKHMTRLMPLYYGRGYTRLHLNDEVEATVIAAMYESMAHEIRAAMGTRFVSPHSPERKHALMVNLVSVKDEKTLARHAKKGAVTFRRHRLGGCMKAGACEYGGVESVARCAGGDDGKPCSDILFDKALAPQIRNDIQRIDQEMSRLPNDSPRYRALLLDRKGMENYLNAVGKH